MSLNIRHELVKKIKISDKKKIDKIANKIEGK